MAECSFVSRFFLNQFEIAVGISHHVARRARSNLKVEHWFPRAILELVTVLGMGGKARCKTWAEDLFAFFSDQRRRSFENEDKLILARVPVA